MESFFGHFKDWAEYRTSNNFTDVKEEILGLKRNIIIVVIDWR
ncbi:hypothetical protein [Cytobacillus purgationiresistens]|uniref:Integrase catalytic domain-containing protein n=1 Tax=Cytobacillus purgationiresistens TaxID=863449 RepID=A0ABU0AGP3_9BACI|nr:hypothetical protein [Cytobacillus purgationiresistens]MDQ0269598.1 hypothetical protein [Cytobacillus purgationiresistens]